MALIASATILVIVLATDLGRKRITKMRLLRAFAGAAIVVAIFVHTIPAGDNEIRLQLIGLGVGAVCGLLAGALLPAHRDSSGEIYTTGGIAYALALAMVLARSAVLFTERHRLRAANDEFAPRAGAEELVAGGGL